MIAEGLLLLAVFGLQAPTLTSSATQEVPERRLVGLCVSPAGRYLVLLSPDRLDIRDATTLKPLKEIQTKSTAIGFDAEDGRLLVVGEQVVRYDTKTWTPQVLGDLPDSRFRTMKFGLHSGSLLPRQAFVTPELDIHYCSEKGVSTAGFENGKLQTKSMGLTWPEDIGPISGFLDFTTDTLMVVLGGTRPAAALAGRVHFLVGSEDPILGTTVAGLGVCVGRETESLYATRTWKILQKRQEEKTVAPAHLCAALDRTTKWVFVGDQGGMHAWSVEKFATVVRYPQFKDPVSQIAVGTQSLYTLEKTTFRRWTIGDQ